MDDAAFPTADGRTVHLKVPYGAGRIALVEENVRIRSKIHGADSVALVDPLRHLGDLAYSRGDLIGAADAFKRLETLTAKCFGPASAAGATGSLWTCEEMLRRLFKMLTYTAPGGRTVPATELLSLLGRDEAVRLLGGRAELQRHSVRLCPHGFDAADPEAAKAGSKLSRRGKEERQRMAVSERKLEKATREAHRRMRGCAGCGAKAGTLLVCSKCMTTEYCSKECSRAHWPVHKPICKLATAQRAKEEAAEAAPSGSGGGGGRAGASGAGRIMTLEDEKMLEELGYSISGDATSVVFF